MKGVGFNSAMEFAEQELGYSVVRERLELLGGLHGDFEVLRLPGSLVPLAAAAAAWVAMDDLRGGSKDERRTFFQRMGVHIADSNLNGVYKTLLALMANPERLAKRIPSLWKTYFRGLSIEVDLDHLKQGLVSTSVTGFGAAPHIGEMAEGWLQFAFELVGGKDVRVFEERLEVGDDAPGRVMRFQISWQV